MYVTIKEIALICGVNKETVRRWIRSNELKASIRSRKNGYLIKKSDLIEFTNKFPKYKSRITLYDELSKNTKNSLIKELEAIKERINELLTLLKGES